MGSSGPVSRYVFLDRLRAVARVDAARAQEHQPLHAGQVRAVDQVGLDHQVLVQEVGAVLVVGLDAADLGRGDEDVVGPLLGQEGVHGALVQQVELGMRAQSAGWRSRRPAAGARWRCRPCRGGR